MPVQVSGKRRIVSVRLQLRRPRLQARHQRFGRGAAAGEGEDVFGVEPAVEPDAFFRRQPRPRGGQPERGVGAFFAGAQMPPQGGAKSGQGGLFST